MQPKVATKTQIFCRFGVPASLRREVHLILWLLWPFFLERPNWLDLGRGFSYLYIYIYMCIYCIYRVYIYIYLSFLLFCFTLTCENDPTFDLYFCKRFKTNGCLLEAGNEMKIHGQVFERKFFGPKALWQFLLLPSIFNKARDSGFRWGWFHWAANDLDMFLLVIFVRIRSHGIYQNCSPPFEEYVWIFFASTEDSQI